MRNTRKKRSPIWLVSREEFIKIVDEAETFGDIFSAFNLKKAGGNYKTLRSRLDYENIDYTNLLINGKNKRINALPKQPSLLSTVLTKNSSYSRSSLKKRLINNGMLKQECYICGLKNIWNGSSLKLSIDHINGINNDNRLCNLRLLCPNCHSQTPTFSGRNNKKPMKTCKQCGEPTEYRKSKTGLCKRCYVRLPHMDKRKVERPSKNELQEMINTMSRCAIGRKYQVSDSAVRKWAKAYKLI